MSSQLDLDDVAATSELAKRQLADLRAEVATPVLVATNRLVDALADARDENARLREALAPSAETKAAYSAKFIFSVSYEDEDGIERPRRVYVPWTTIKEIMAAIQASAALKD